jgi:hypothetical protein
VQFTEFQRGPPAPLSPAQVHGPQGEAAGADGSGLHRLLGGLPVRALPGDTQAAGARTTWQPHRHLQLLCQRFSNRCVAKTSSRHQGFGSGSAWIRINLSCWIRFRIQIAGPDPDPAGQK